MTEPQPEPPESLPESPQAAAQATCWWHPERPTGLRCTRCERPACVECLREAAVGYQCVDCVADGRREDKARAARHRSSGFGHRTVAGARASRQLVVTPVLIAANVLVFLITMVQAQSVMDNHLSSLFVDWSLISPLAAQGEWWRLLSSGFLHFGPFHLLMNMLALYFLGRELEVLLGKARYLALYTLSLLGGGAAVFVFEEIGSQTAGASGAIYGLLGGVLIAAIRLRLDLTYILFIIGINVVISFQISGISWIGHAGGFVAGVLVTAALVYAPERARLPLQVGTMLAVAAALVVLVVVRDGDFGEMVCQYDVGWYRCLPVGLTTAGGG